MKRTASHGLRNQRRKPKRVSFDSAARNVTAEFHCDLPFKWTFSCMETITSLLSNLKLLSSETWLQKVRAGVKHMSVLGHRVINMFVAAVDICLLSIVLSAHENDPGNNGK